MKYIVFDLEWNQCPYGKSREDPRLPFEIIEIGAVKLDYEKNIVDTFRCLVRPALYTKLHFQTKKVVGLTDRDLMKGTPFPEAVSAFLKWCGDDRVFCTWGPSDLTELQRNLEYHGMGGIISGPLVYEDVQKLFAIAYEKKSDRRALSHAVEALSIPLSEDFHLAKADAMYTAKVLQRIPDEVIRNNFSVDCYDLPKSREDEAFFKFETYEKFISRGFDTKEALLADRDVMAVRCIECGKNARRVIKWFADVNGRNYLSVGKCREHGLVKSKLRLRESVHGKFYAVRTTKLIGESEMKKIHDKQLHIVEKRQNKHRK